MAYRGRHTPPRPSRRQTLIGATGIVAVLAMAAGFALLQPLPPGPALADGRQPAPAALDEGSSPGSTGAPSPASSDGTGRTPAGNGVTELPTRLPTQLPAPRATASRPGTPTADAPRAAAVLTSPCRPTGLLIDALEVDAPVIEIGLERDGSLGVPAERDRRKAGWYPSVLAGAARGTVLMDGHTYRDGSAIFTTDSTARAELGTVLRLTCDDGSVVSYRLTELRSDLTPETYPDFISSRRLYAADGPAQLVMITCTGWNPLRQVWDNRAVLIATPFAASSG
ncbi:sortase domain-bontaining protein [Humibacillus xanthopallidus]|uniref:class F sortase n=1 Tax=Humibacillus xanthopallidus TaxID=412689 RepID=UPI00384C712D